MLRCAEFTRELADAPVLRRMSQERLEEYGGTLSAILGDPKGHGSLEEIYRLTLKLYALGDETSALTLALFVYERAEAPLRQRAAARAGRCYYELGLLSEAEAILHDALHELPGQAAAEVMRPILDNMLGNVYELAGRDVEAEHQYHLCLRAARRLDDGWLVRNGFSPKPMLLHPPQMNLIEIGVKRALRLDGLARFRQLEAIHAQLDEGLQSGPPVEFTGMYQTLRGMALTAEDRLDDARRHFDELETPLRVSPDMNWVLPLMLRERARVHSRRGDLAAAYRDLRRAMSVSQHNVAVLEERRAVSEIFAVLAEMHGNPANNGRTTQRTMQDGTAGGGAEDESYMIEVFAHEAQGLLGDVVDCLEQKDWYTGHGHSRAVTTLSLRLHEALPENARRGIDPERLRVSALLHDIGKMTVPWTLLNKTAPLSDWELRYLQGHAAAGGELLDIIGLNTAAEVARGHHRRHEGGGYPDPAPLSEPYTALVAVADAFEAMITPNRRYRKSRTVSEAVEEIGRCAPSQFHPVAAGALAALYAAS